MAGGLSLAYIGTDSSTTQRDEKEHRSSRFRLGGKKEAAGVCRGRGPYKYIYMEFQWAFSCQVPSRNTAGNAFSCRKLRMALKRPETACPGTENVGDFDGRPGHGCRYRHMTRTLHQPITCAKAKTAATAAPAASFLPTNQPGTVSKLYSLLRGRSADMTFKVIGVPYPDTNEESW